MINAAGRISNATTALMTLEADNDQRAKELAEELYNLNSMRKDIQNEIIEKVNESLAKDPKKRKSILEKIEKKGTN